MAVFVVPRGKPPQLLMNTDIGADKVDTMRPMWGPLPRWTVTGSTSTEPRARQERASSGSRCRSRDQGGDLVHSDAGRYGTAGPGRQAVTGQGADPADGGVSQTLSVFQRGGRWYAVSKRNEVSGPTWWGGRRRRPPGRGDRGTKVADLPSDPTTGELRYMPLAHPDLAARRLVLVSYKRNNTDAAKVNGDRSVPPAVREGDAAEWLGP